MGFLSPKAPAIVQPDPPVTISDDQIAREEDAAADRARARRGSTDTSLTGPTLRRGALAESFKNYVGS